jgi:sugar phosphate permease
MFLNHIDRSNISYAALQMNQDLGFTPSVYGFAAGVFFFGYVIFEVPSNLILARVGARHWIARIMLTWGVIATAMAWINSAETFYVLRFLLGVAEAGFLPGMFYYYSLWFPASVRGKAISFLMMTSPITNIIAAPLSTSLFALDGFFGLRGWQFIFIIEGVPAILVALIVLRYLTNNPSEAKWLSNTEKDWLRNTLADERKNKEISGATTLKQGFFDRRVLLITAVGFFLVCTNFGIAFWLPQIIKAFGGLTNMQIGELTALPYVFGVICMMLWGRHSDSSGDRKWHLVISSTVTAVACVIAALSTAPILSFIGLCIAIAGILSVSGVFWALPSDFLADRAAAGGFAFINSFGLIGGFVGPYVVGLVRDRTHSFSGSLLAVAGFAVVTALLSALLQNQQGVKAAKYASATE